MFRSGTVSYEAAINASGVCTVPWEVLTAPDNKFSALAGGCIKMFVSVVGTLGTVIIPTKEIRVELSVSGLTEALNSAEPTPDIYAQYVTTIQEDNDATVAEIAADNDETAAEVEALTVRSEAAATSAEASAARMKNDYCNALKGTVSGEVVRVDDVSPVEHNPVVKVKSKNFFDISKIPTMTASASYAYISEVGNDYFIITTAATYDGNGYCTVSKTLKEVCPNLEIGKTYILTATTESNSTNVYLPAIQKSWIFGRPMVMTETILNSTMTFYGLSVAAGMGTGNCRISNIQIEEGDTATEYTPYVDPSTATLTRCGKNLMQNNIYDMEYNGITISKNEDKTFIVNGTATDNCYFTLNSGVKLPNGRYKLSGCNIGGGPDKYILYATTDDNFYTQDVGKGVEFNYSSDTPLPIRMAVYKGTVMNNVLIKPMLCLAGNDDDGYEAYNGTTYTPAADGSCDVVSLSPTMTLLTDTEGVTVECEYNRDINAVITDILTKING